MDTLDKLTILAEAAKYDVACTSSGVSRGARDGFIGMASNAGCCHAFSPDGRCITLLKVLMSNACSFDCAYCINRSSASTKRATFTPQELANLTIDFYQRNYIEGLFLSSGVLGCADATTERMIACLRILREDFSFRGYIHAKVIPGTSPELIDTLGRLADRLSSNIELPSAHSLELLCPQKTREKVLAPIKQIYETSQYKRKAFGSSQKKGTSSSALPDPSLAGVFAHTSVDQSLAEQKSLGQRAVTQPSAGQSPSTQAPANQGSGLQIPAERTPSVQTSVTQLKRGWRTSHSFAPAGQATQLIIGATPEDDRHILMLSQALYTTYQLKRVFFSAYIPLISDQHLPSQETPIPLRREHRLYQADWLMRFYSFTPDELVREDAPWLDLDVDPKLAWALNHPDIFPLEIMDAPFDMLLRIPGVGPTGARRIWETRKTQRLSFDDLAAFHIVLKRARYFIRCSGKQAPESLLDPSTKRKELIAHAQDTPYNRRRRVLEKQPALF